MGLVLIITAALGLLIFKMIKQGWNWWFTKDVVGNYIREAEQELDHVEQSEEEVELVNGKIPRRKRGSFRNFLVMQGKAKFGTPKLTEANRMCVRKYLYDICKEHHVLPRHIVDNLDFAVEMVMIPSEPELKALALRKSVQSKTRSLVRKALVGDDPNVA